jgi:FKBP12-rapamycin complex-associated protein
MDRFREIGRTTDLHQAWEIYHKVFKRINAQLKALKTVNLHHVSSKLCAAQSLSLAVPGTFALHEIITISSFSTTIDVIASKQRPRKITMVSI